MVPKSLSSWQLSREFSQSFQWETARSEGGNPSKALDTYLAMTSPGSLVVTQSPLPLSREVPAMCLGERAEGGNPRPAWPWVDPCMFLGLCFLTFVKWAHSHNKQRFFLVFPFSAWGKQIQGGEAALIFTAVSSSWQWYVGSRRY